MLGANADAWVCWLPVCDVALDPDCDKLLVVGCIADCSDSAVEPVEPDRPSYGYHPLFCRNGYHPFSSAALTLKGIKSKISNTAIFRDIILSLWAK